MKCAGCDTMHHGIGGLMPRRLEGKARGMQTHEMLCQTCHKERHEARDKYKAASHGD